MKRIVLHRFQSLIERDAFVARLRSLGVPCDAPGRDMIVNLTDQPNLSLGVYSALFDGYAVFVPAAAEARARSELANFRRESQLHVVVEKPVESGVDAPGARFLRCTLWSLVVPVVMNLMALYWLFRSRNVFQLKPFLSAVALFLNVFILAVAAVSF
ncbi:MAG: hypothetical protein KF865_00940 [Bdellovibrionaceae bacterium]|nr:hypothetical protein [Pseudobdellovibrionaceae bacterium]